MLRRELLFPLKHHCQVPVLISTTITMASSPQPADIREGAETAEADENPALPANAEDRKAAEAMSSLERRGDDDEDSSKSKNVDTEALGKAMKDLGATESGTSMNKGEEKKIKIDGADVILLVSYCATNFISTRF